MSTHPSYSFPLRTLYSLAHLHTVCSILATRVSVRAQTLSCSDFVTPQTVACQDPLSMGFPRQEYWSRLPFPTRIPRQELWIPRQDFPDLGIKPESLPSLALACRFFTTQSPGKPLSTYPPRHKSISIPQSSSAPPPPRHCLEFLVETDLSFSEFPWYVTNLSHCTFQFLYCSTLFLNYGFFLLRTCKLLEDRIWIWFISVSPKALGTVFHKYEAFDKCLSSK